MKFIYLICSLLLLKSTLIAQTTNPAPYCQPTPTPPNIYGHTCDGAISKVQLGSLNHSSSFSPPYTYFNSITPPVLYKGNTYTIKVTFDTIEHSSTTFSCYPDNSMFGAWIDYNHNSHFEGFGSGATEVIMIDTNNSPSGWVNAISSAVTISQSFTVPATAVSGITRMRISRTNACIYAVSTFNCLSPCDCGPIYSPPPTMGETKDYNVDIEDAPTEVASLLQTNFELSPNPTDGSIVVTSTSIRNAVCVYNMIGTVMYQNTFEQNKFGVDLATIPVGVYFIKVNETVKKIIKK